MITLPPCHFGRAGTFAAAADFGFAICAAGEFLFLGLRSRDSGMAQKRSASAAALTMARRDWQHLPSRRQKRQKHVEAAQTQHIETGHCGDRNRLVTIPHQKVLREAADSGYIQK
jgi:hypothetical protein